MKCYCDSCYNVVYNSVPLGLLKEAEAVKKLSPRSVRLSFSFESAGETKEIAEQFLQAYLHGSVPETDREYTRGHFRRRVE